MICNYDSCPCNVRDNGRCNSCMPGLGILVGILGGIVFAVAAVLLFNGGFLPQFTFAAWTTLVVSIVYLFAVLISGFVSSERGKNCIRCNLGGVMSGIIGAAVSSILAVSAELAAGEVFSIVVVALTAFFFVYMLVSALFLIICAVNDRIVQK